MGYSRSTYLQAGEHLWCTSEKTCVPWMRWCLGAQTDFCTLKASKASVPCTLMSLRESSLYQQNDRLVDACLCFPFLSSSYYDLNFMWYSCVILRVNSTPNIKLNKIIRSWKKKKIMLSIWCGVLVFPSKGCGHTGQRQWKRSAKAVKTKINDCSA